MDDVEQTVQISTCTNYRITSIILIVGGIRGKLPGLKIYIDILTLVISDMFADLIFAMNNLASFAYFTLMQWTS